MLINVSPQNESRFITHWFLLLLRFISSIIFLIIFPLSLEISCSRTPILFLSLSPSRSFPPHPLIPCLIFSLFPFSPNQQILHDENLSLTCVSSSILYVLMSEKRHYIWRWSAGNKTNRMSEDETLSFFHVLNFKIEDKEREREIKRGREREEIKKKKRRKTRKWRKYRNRRKDKPAVILSDTCFCHPFLFEENCSKSLLVKMGSKFVLFFLKLILRDYPLLSR